MNKNSAFSANGVTVRDYFAAAAMKSLLDRLGSQKDYTIEAVVKDAYYIADLMEKAR